jgi:hypothetical protein
MAKKSSKHQSNPANTVNLGNLATEPTKTNSLTKEPTLIATNETTVPPATSPPISGSDSSPGPFSYKPITDIVSIERLAGLAKDSPHDSALGIVWKYAYDEGYQKGRKEILQDLKKKLEERFKEGETEGIKKGREIYYGKGIVRGEYDEHQRWKAAGHGQHCFTAAACLEDSETQTDAPVVIVTGFKTRTGYG